MPKPLVFDFDVKKRRDGLGGKSEVTVALGKRNKAIIFMHILSHHMSSEWSSLESFHCHWVCLLPSAIRALTLVNFLFICFFLLSIFVLSYPLHDCSDHVYWHLFLSQVSIWVHIHCADHGEEVIPMIIIAFRSLGASHSILHVFFFSSRFVVVYWTELIISSPTPRLNLPVTCCSLAVKDNVIYRS